MSGLAHGFFSAATRTRKMYIVAWRRTHGAGGNAFLGLLCDQKPLWSLVIVWGRPEMVFSSTREEWLGYVVSRVVCSAPRRLRILSPFIRPNVRRLRPHAKPLFLRRRVNTETLICHPVVRRDMNRPLIRIRRECGVVWWRLVVAVGIDLAIRDLLRVCPR
jgi:hypothetical protein